MRVNATDLQNAFGKYLALTEKEDIIITKNGRSVAKLVRFREPDYYLLHEESQKYKTTKRISYEEYIALVESSDQRYELIDGEVFLLATPSYSHQVVVNEISGRFYNFFKGKPCQSLTAPFEVRLFGYATRFEEDPNVVQPDVLVICDQDKVNEDNKYEGVPSLVVEVLAPSTKSKDMILKTRLYLKSGVREYWIVDPENKSIYQYIFSEEKELEEVRNIRESDIIKSTLFEGLEISLDDIFSQI